MVLILLNLDSTDKAICLEVNGQKAGIPVIANPINSLVWKNE